MQKRLVQPGRNLSYLFEVACSQSPAYALLRCFASHLLQGPSAKEVNRDSTAFERARAEWSKATVSHRGKVGGGGDAKAQNWLG